MTEPTTSPPSRSTLSPLRIALVAPPMEPVPPVAYGGTERVVAALAEQLVARGHDVTVFAAGDSKVAGRLVPVIPTSLWSTGYRGDVSSYMAIAMAEVWRRAEEFDLIHSHLEGLGLIMAGHCPVPVVTTLHGRLDGFGMPELLETFPDAPLVAISESQRRWSPMANWMATIHHGLPLEDMPFSARPGEYLAVVGRCAPEKGLLEAIEVSKATGVPVRIAAKAYDTDEVAYLDGVIRPALADAPGEFLGELPPAQRDPLYASAAATLMLGAWPEPFGLVAIESLACGTPVIARRAGALPEIVEHGVDGFIVDDVAEAKLAVKLARDLDRAAIRRRATQRFRAQRMADDYEDVYRRLVAAQELVRKPKMEQLVDGRDVGGRIKPGNLAVLARNAEA